MEYLRHQNIIKWGKCCFEWIKFDCIGMHTSTCEFSCDINFVVVTKAYCRSSTIVSGNIATLPNELEYLVAYVLDVM